MFFCLIPSTLLTMISFITDFDGISRYVDWYYALLRSPTWFRHPCMLLYAGTCGWFLSGWSTLLSTLAKAYITLRFLCGKEPVIGGVVCLRTRGSKLSPLDTIYCATLINSPAFSFNYLENSAVLPEWLFYSLVVFCSVLWRWTNITFLEARPLNTFGFIYLWM